MDHKWINGVVIVLGFAAMIFRLGLLTTGAVVLGAGTAGFLGAWYYANRGCVRLRIDHKLACGVARVRYWLDPTPLPTAEELKAWKGKPAYKNWERGVITPKDLARSLRQAA